MANEYCPLCGGENKCMAGTLEQINCWCGKEIGFPKELLELVPQESRGKHCICKKCLDKFMDNA